MTDENVMVESRLCPKVQQLEEIAKQAQSFETSVKIEFDNAKPIPINASRVCTLIVAVAVTPRWQRPKSMLELCNSQGYWYRGFLSAGMLAMADLCRGERPFTERGKVLHDSITVKSKGASLPGKDLKKLALEAWCEAFEVSPPDFVELKVAAGAKKSAEADLQSQLLQELRSGPEGVKAWNKRKPGAHGSGNFKKADLQAVDLTEVRIYGQDFRASNFNSATMTKAKIMNCDLRQSTFRDAHMDGIEFSHETQSTECDFTAAILAQADLRGKFNDCNFTGATLAGAQMYDVDFGGCNFLNADLRGASCCQCDFAGADLSQANLADVDFDWSSYDRDTKWPAEFAKPEKDALQFKGRGMDPLLLRQVKAKAQSGPVNFETFVDHLLNSFDSDRLKKSLKMLKSEKFQLFSEVGETSIAGIVKSQTDPDLVYSCRLTNEGQFSCCTQNLFACGGLRGALCKHLLVLLIGLAKANELDPTKTFQWVIQSQAQKPLLDREVAGEILLRYKGSEAGDIDWRPTETMPEDYYAY